MSSMYGSSGMGNKVPSGYNVGRIQNYSPEQMSLFRSLFSHVSPDSYLGRLAGGDQSSFEQMEAPALKQFSALQGNLASRFSGMGGLGARRSSGFQNTANQAASDFAENLQSRRMDLQRQALQDLMGMSGQLLNSKPYEQFLTPKQPSFLQSLMGGLGSLGGTALGALGGGIGSGAGLGMANKWFNLFGNKGMGY